MGLDWNPGNRAKPGFEAEFAELFAKINATAESAPDLVRRYHEISTTAFQTLGAPVVGRDAEADAWARQLRIDMASDMTEEEFLTELSGFAVLPLVAPCDGLPKYTNGSPGGYVEAYSFRGQFLRDCEDDLGPDLFASGYDSKLPEELFAYGQELLAVAATLAERHGLDLLDLVVPDLIPTVEEFAAGAESPTAWSVEHRVDVMYSAGRWCLFWAERGHLLDAYW